MLIWCQDWLLTLCRSVAECVFIVKRDRLDNKDQPRPGHIYKKYIVYYYVKRYISRYNTSYITNEIIIGRLPTNRHLIRWFA